MLSCNAGEEQRSPKSREYYKMAADQEYTEAIISIRLHNKGVRGRGSKSPRSSKGHYKKPDQRDAEAQCYYAHAL